LPTSEKANNKIKTYSLYWRNRKEHIKPKEKKQSTIEIFKINMSFAGFKNYSKTLYENKC
jgi:hypothetical protein